MPLRKISPRQQNKIGDFFLSFPSEPFIVWSIKKKIVIKIDPHYITSLPSFSYECEDSFSPTIAKICASAQKAVQNIWYALQENGLICMTDFIPVILGLDEYTKIMQAGNFSVHGDEI